MTILLGLLLASTAAAWAGWTLRGIRQASDRQLLERLDCLTGRCDQCGQQDLGQSIALAERDGTDPRCVFLCHPCAARAIRQWWTTLRQVDPGLVAGLMDHLAGLRRRRKLNHDEGGISGRKGKGNAD